MERFSYKQARKRLDEILQFFESGDFDLEKGRELFKEAIELIKKSLKRVEEIENEIVEIKKESK
ncbi:MAG: exodeoxyribonuclease VII small subunit [Candidatus Portnoybacteria bacterium]|nr:exodeoxyribonuclease VII small subunit [Candidatus Portnoybacteria bacterium]